MQIDKIQLSPLNLSGLLSGWRGKENPNAATGKKRKRAHEVTYWACPVCGERFDEYEEKEAEACCQGQGNGLDDESPGCPVCEQRYTDHREAADCCLWKDIDAPTRYRMADAVAAGSSWADELGVQSNV